MDVPQSTRNRGDDFVGEDFAIGDNNADVRFDCLHNVENLGGGRWREHRHTQHLRQVRDRRGLKILLSPIGLRRLGENADNVVAGMVDRLQS